MFTSPTNKPVLYFFYRMLRFILIFALLDLGGGWLLNKLYFAQKTGNFYRTTHGIAQTEADIVLIGTSHAVRHYIPAIFKDSLNKSCYNMGARGQNIYYCAAVVDQLLDRHTPETMIWDIDPFMFYTPEKYDKLSVLRPYFRQYRSLRKYITLQSPWEKVKLFSGFYTYNSTVVRMLKYTIAPQKDFNGYIPLNRVTTIDVSETSQNLEKPEFDTTDDQMGHLERIVKKAKDQGVDIIFVISPILAGDRIYSSNIENLSHKYDIPLWNYSLDRRFIFKNELFGDQSHLNHNGAMLFSAELSSRLKDRISKKNLK